MFANNLNPFFDAHVLTNRSSENIHTRHYHIALNQFRSALRRGAFFRLISRLFRRQPYLYDLNALKPDLRLRGSYYVGVQVVPIGSIIGSEGRVADFDASFHPISEEARGRWVNLALARLACVTLPPVQLVQVGDGYFVRDGHHRISVARAFGQVAVDAEVIAWKAVPPFPWQPCCSEIPQRQKSPHLSV